LEHTERVVRLLAMIVGEVAKAVEALRRIH